MTHTLGVRQTTKVSSPVTERKVALRRALRAARRERLARSDPRTRHDLGVCLADALEGYLAGTGTTCVAAFESMPTEPPTEVLIDRLRAAGHQVIVPVLLADKDLSWRDTETGADLGPAAIGRASLIVLPALAVDRDGQRLGQGGGSYDRALRRSDPEALRLAVVFEQEVLAAVPAEIHDEPVGAVLTPDKGVRRLPLTG